jgi:hypothetical protein
MEASLDDTRKREPNHVQEEELEASVDDTRKRDSKQVVKDVAEEKSKKARSLNKAKPTSPAVIEKSNASSSKPDGKAETDAKEREGQSCWDLESALLRIVQVGDGVSEPLSESVSVKFRVAHAGDASSLATCYQKSFVNGKVSNRVRKSSDCSEEDTSFEVRLAESLGDEDNPPYAFALLAELFTDETTPPKIGAAALLTPAWQEQSRVVRVEWLYVDREQTVADLLERRLWLRLSTLSLMTSCELVLEESRSDDKASS